MFDSNRGNTENQFLNQIRHLSLAGFELRISPEYFKMGQPVFENPAVVDRIIFPVDAIISIEYCVDEDACAELVTVGREGFIGISWVSGCDFMLGRAVVRQPGEVLLMNVKTFNRLLQLSATAKRLCDRYVLYRMACMAQRTACRMNHTVLQRLSQKLLVWEDRNGNRGEFTLTHRNLANMLGVHRATASEHLSRLQALGVMTYNHGRVVICDREELLEKSCDCYGVAKTLYRQLMIASGLREYSGR